MLLLCSTCGKIVILDVFKTGITIVSFFACCLNCVVGVFKSSVATPALGLPRLRFILMNASLLALYICTTTHGPTSLSR